MLRGIGSLSRNRSCYCDSNRLLRTQPVCHHGSGRKVGLHGSNCTGELLACWSDL